MSRAPTPTLNLGDIFLSQGDLALAWEMLNGVHRLVHDPTTSAWMRWRYSMHLFASLGELWLARGEAVRAQECANQCLEIATRTHAQKYLVRGWRLRGEIALVRHQRDEAATWLRQALTRAQTLGNPTQLWKTHVALGRFQRAARRPAQARQAYLRSPPGYCTGPDTPAASRAACQPGAASPADLVGYFTGTMRCSYGVPPHMIHGPPECGSEENRVGSRALAVQ